MPPTIDPKFRVIRIPDSLRDAIKTTREARETTNAAIIEAAVNGNLEDLEYGAAGSRLRAGRRAQEAGEISDQR